MNTYITGEQVGDIIRNAAPVISRASTEGHSYERDYPRTA